MFHSSLWRYLVIVGSFLLLMLIASYREGVKESAPICR